MHPLVSAAAEKRNVSFSLTITADEINSIERVNYYLGRYDESNWNPANQLGAHDPRL